LDTKNENEKIETMFIEIKSLFLFAFEHHFQFHVALSKKKSYLISVSGTGFFQNRSIFEIGFFWKRKD
jgi:hypothetical protein